MGLKVTAIVTLDDNGVIIHKEHFGSDVNDNLKLATKAHLAERYKLYHQRITDYFTKNNITGTVVMEEPMGVLLGNAKRLMELKGVYLVALADICEIHKIFLPKATEIKKSFTGSGRSNKDAMITECKKRGYLPRHDHEADAIAMALMSIDNKL